MKIVFAEYFNQSEGKPFIYEGKEVKLSNKFDLTTNKIKLKLTFISTDSEWKQGIALTTKGEFEINGSKVKNGVVFWEDTAPKQVEMIIKSKNKILFVYNVWRGRSGIMHYGHNGGALYTEQVGDATIFHCNDGHPNDDFTDLIFKVEYNKVEK